MKCAYSRKNFSVTSLTENPVSTLRVYEQTRDSHDLAGDIVPSLESRGHMHVYARMQEHKAKPDRPGCQVFFHPKQSPTQGRDSNIRFGTITQPHGRVERFHSHILFTKLLSLHGPSPAEVSFTLIPSSNISEDISGPQTDNAPALLLSVPVFTLTRSPSA